MMRHLRNGRPLEEARNLELNLRNVVDVPENARGQERVSARREEIIVNTDLLDPEDLCPALGQRFLKRRPWRDESRRLAAATRQSQLGRQANTLHLAGRALRDLIDNEDMARDLEVGDAADGELTKVFRRRGGMGPQHDGSRDILPQRGVGDGKCHGLRHRWMLQDDVFDFLRGDFLPAAIDSFEYAPGKKQVPVVIEETEIAGLEPIAGKRGLGRHWVAVIARCDAYAPYDDLARPAAGQQSPSFVHDRDVQIPWEADRTELALARRQRIASNVRGSGFRHSVALDHRGLEGLLHLGQDVGR